ncbi:hypothetical protein QFC20_004103 [Naganishia adeliensis]|uniref:Uncharacterized protein n=1 Tax=Naganishia adeliensis TaxID=92952 RepID=A0ACC2W2W3_9TREE|nr:hypothetical protein QFC20_004103 [Naganishia adeliensis]
MVAVHASYRISPPAGTPVVKIPTENDHIIDVQPDAANGPSQDGDNPVNADDSPYYLALLSSLADAKEKLNADMTIWKEAVGDREKQKDAVSAAHKGKQGLGKAMMMVKAAKENDALPDDDDEDEEEEEDADDIE